MRRDLLSLMSCLLLAGGFLFAAAPSTAGEAPQAEDLAATASQFSVRTAADLINYGADLDAAVEIAPNVYQARGTGNAGVPQDLAAGEAGALRRAALACHGLPPCSD